MKVSVFQIFGLVGTLASELTRAASDGKITVDEGLSILKTICSHLGVDLVEVPKEVEQVSSVVEAAAEVAAAVVPKPAPKPAVIPAAKGK